METGKRGEEGNYIYFSKNKKNKNGGRGGGGGGVEQKKKKKSPILLIDVIQAMTDSRTQLFPEPVGLQGKQEVFHHSNGQHPPYTRQQALLNLSPLHHGHQQSAPAA